MGNRAIFSPSLPQFHNGKTVTLEWACFATEDLPPLECKIIFFWDSSRVDWQMYFSSCFILLFVSSSYHIFFCRLLQSPFCSFCMFCSCIFFSWNYLDFFKFVLLFLLTTFLFFSLIQLFLNVNVIRFDPKLQIPICSCVFFSISGRQG